MIYDLIIIGLGPAGITAGIYAKRQNLNCLVVGKSFGGQMMSKAVDIENYPGFEKISGFDLMEKMSEQLISKGVQVIEDEVLEVKKDDIFKVKLSSKEVYGKSIIIATGANHRHLGIEGEDKYLGRGLSYCTTCDGPLFRDKIVAVIGGGEAGFEAARFLSSYTSKIYILERGKEVLASKTNQEIVASLYPKIEIILEAEIKRIEGNSNVERIVFKKKEEEIILSVDGVFIQIGYVPASSIFKDLVNLNSQGEILINKETCETSTQGIFAAGDVSDGKVKQIIVACSEGAKAAMYAYKYLNKN
ncbi:MAG: FAD-dependent oxidoreductase [Candidatus Pacebacteria bacterium]|nr:FAD-dependent oxidoreductase [Candidatus Paceibacterota bacterium]